MRNHLLNNVGKGALLLALCAGPCAAIGSPQAPGSTSTLCRFTVGPRAGQTQDYAPLAPNAVGAPCEDGKGSKGTIVAATLTAANSREAAKPPVMLCRYTVGPRKGLTLDLTSLTPISLGSPCGDGAGSAGTVVSSNSGPVASAQSSTVISATGNPIQGMTTRPIQATGNPIEGMKSPIAPLRGGTVSNAGGVTVPQTSTLCGITAGPKAGTIENYAPQQAVAVGTLCGDGAGNTGTVVAAGSPAPRGNFPEMSTLCALTAGPKAGRIEDYAPQQAVAAGSPCSDGAGSTGVVVPRPAADAPR